MLGCFDQKDLAQLYRHDLKYNLQFFENLHSFHSLGITQCFIFWVSFKISLLEHSANSTKTVGSIPIWAIHLTTGLDDHCGSLPTQTILWICNFLLHIIPTKPRYRNLHNLSLMTQEVTIRVIHTELATCLLVPYWKSLSTFSKIKN